MPRIELQLEWRRTDSGETLHDPSGDPVSPECGISYAIDMSAGSHITSSRKWVAHAYGMYRIFGENRKAAIDWVQDQVAGEMESNGDGLVKVTFRMSG